MLTPHVLYLLAIQKHTAYNENQKLVVLKASDFMPHHILKNKFYILFLSVFFTNTINAQMKKFYKEEAPHYDIKMYSAYTIALSIELTEAAKQGDLERLATLLEAKANPNHIVDEQAPHQRALYWAALFGHTEAVALLLNHGATIPNTMVNHKVVCYVPWDSTESFTEWIHRTKNTTESCFFWWNRPNLPLNKRLIKHMLDTSWAGGAYREQKFKNELKAYPENPFPITCQWLKIEDSSPTDNAPPQSSQPSIVADNYEPIDTHPIAIQDASSLNTLENALSPSLIEAAEEVISEDITGATNYFTGLYNYFRNALPKLTRKTGS
jgi:hypothetical protein